VVAVVAAVAAVTVNSSDSLDKTKHWMKKTNASEARGLLTCSFWSETQNFRDFFPLDDKLAVKTILRADDRDFMWNSNSTWGFTRE
jgi:hypothetical protein